MADSAVSGTISNHVRLIDWLQSRVKTTFIAFVFFGVSVFTCWASQHFGCSGLGWYLCVPFWLGFILCGSILLVLLLDFYRIRWWRLRSLAGDEREVLREFVEKDKTTAHWNALDDAPKSLSSEGILSAVRVPSEGYAYYTLRPWILRYLKRHPRLIAA